MDGFNGTLFAYGQTSSGKTHTMMGDQQNEGVIPKAVGEIYDYIENRKGIKFLTCKYKLLDIKDLLNPSKTNLKIHENTQKQVYVGELTEEVVSCGEDIFKHMMRGEKNRHFGETNMNDRSSKSHTIFRVVIESREMMEENKDRDAIDGAVRVAHFGQRLKEGGHINKSLLALGTVIAKLSEGESFIPFRDSKLTRILQSSLGGNAKTSMICTITPAAIEESNSTLKFASRAKTIKNCPEVNEVLDDGTLLKRYRKEIRELKKQLTKIGGSSHVEELQIEKEKVFEMEEMLEQQRRQQSEQEEKIKKLCNMICSAGREPEPKRKAKMTKRRETWCPGAALSKTPLASAAALAASVQSRLQRISSSPSSEESEFDGITREAFLSTLNDEEERKSSEDGRRKVVFTSPRVKRCLSPIIDTEQDDKEIQTEPDERNLHMELEVKKLRKDLNEAIQTRDLYNELLEESNALLEKMSTESGRSLAPTNSDITLKYVADLRNEKTDLETQVSVLKKQCQDLGNIKGRNKELEDEVRSMENERTLSSEYLTELQAEFDSVQAERQALAARVEGLENTGAFNTAVKMEVDSLQMTLEKTTREKEQLEETLETWQEKYAGLENDVARLQKELSCAAEEKQQFEEKLSRAREDSVKANELEIRVKEMEGRLSNVDEQERMLTEIIEQKLQLEESKKVEITSLRMALEESAKEKGRVEETLETWQEKCAGLENDVARLQKELACAAEEKQQFEEKLSRAREDSVKANELEIQVNEMEGRLSNVDEQERMLTEVIQQKLQLEESKKVEVTSLQMALDERAEEKERVEETLETWKEKYASLENDVERLQKELACAAEEKLRFEEKLSRAREDSVKANELEIRVKETEGRLSNVDEQERMLSEVIQQKLQLEESQKVEVTSLQMALEESAEEKGRVEETLETWQEKYAGLENDVARLQTELACAAEEKLRFEEKLSRAREDSVKANELEIRVKEMEGRLSNVDEQERMLTEIIEQKLQLEENVEQLKAEVAQSQVIVDEKCNIEARLFEKFKADKESEVTKLTKELEELQEQLKTRSCGFEEKDMMVVQVIEQKREVETKMSELQIQLERMNNEKEEYEQTLNRVKKERDEIKNDLSESITDSAEFQKDLLDMQQKVKRYKEHMRELESELEQREAAIISHEEKTEGLQNQLSQALEKIEQSSRDINDETTSEEESSNGQKVEEIEHDTLRVEKQRAKEFAEECNSLKCSLETLSNRNDVLEDEAKSMQREVTELQQRIKGLESQLIESKQACEVSKEQLVTEKEKCEGLVKELNEHKSTECRAKELPASFSFEVELQKVKRESEELVKELAEERKANETLR
ncbi:hypothetical protein OS493_025393 [Desmophyllum pertusum]|uniref:Kinesin motor domain-containing protein n=1 Tax=Desmophyllum pertusum TaxID=174260 RepID=A0A9W9YXV0_9CNID|nr:hypothetical protein OS493_025393 [Desmophyllum pertusum]